MSEKLNISALATKRREEAIQRSNPAVLVEKKSRDNKPFKADMQFDPSQGGGCNQLMAPCMSCVNPLQIDPEHVSRIRLAVGLLFLINALSNVYFGDPASLSTGRWSWVYRLVTATFGTIGYPILQAIIGLAFIAWSRRKF
ncbi:hypothetical protein ACLIKD_05850 [Azonexus sp. IMCC34842]|uniref:hypothetical protein n=1 Tax=Azonexus sp. IMCC34842 TaxID=3420950 RepID=UPI003D0B8852